MGSKFWPKRGSPGILHHFTETLVAFEFTKGSRPKPHSILFLGGLGDGLATTSYVADVVAGLEPTPWSLFSLNLTSSYQAWGFGHLDRDTDEIAQCIRHIRDYKTAEYGSPGKLVLMGHSTGSQCVLHYLSRPNPHTSEPPFDRGLEHVVRPAVDGAIMQAPVSDREALQLIMRDGFLGRTPAELRDTFDRLVATAREAVARDPGCDSMLPISLTAQFGYPRNTPVSCRRFLSLASPDSPESPSEDDTFSSDLPDRHLARTFGMIRSRGLLRHTLMVLMSGADQAVPDWVDKEALLERWRRATDADADADADADGAPPPIWDRQRSGLIPGASHALSNDDQAEPRAFLVRRVLDYLGELEQKP
ncbi:hypothetical protein MYCTH_40734 [Thermothelomyces thermophilus ATCC 42464]|uniref:Uncharacterized protein n=1 Tax=Thermothelomyces thermophilus (strain ATCC 42464 / BCRC 31852 / DSM 1799) TaxID=573729 RepID=G2PZL4_THET4|nr:uncharacterized protein MYCTH_40734 [Thermothelomyces thermophilus ATCC 42464]AEO55700.1 hypothetical protein MYCTH_40734 [Thermothelomyces thermophilus ATCC 42464]